MRELIRKMKYIYISAPYTHPDPVENTYKVIRVADELLKKGYIPIIPHLSLLWHLISPKPIEVWYNYDIELMKKADAVLRLEGESVGADKEVELAKKWGMPVLNIKDL